MNSAPICELTLRREALWRKYNAATPNGPLKVWQPLPSPLTLHASWNPSAPLCTPSATPLHPICTVSPHTPLPGFCNPSVVLTTDVFAAQVSRSSFLAYLDQPCFRLQTCKSCLCGPCEEHGWQNFEDLNVLIKVPTTVLLTTSILLTTYYLQLTTDYILPPTRHSTLDPRPSVAF